MARVQNKRFFFLGWMLAMAGFAVAEQVDPRFPSERIAVFASDWSRWLPSRIRQMEAERDLLMEKISALPQHKPNFLSERLGYHSPFEEFPADGVLLPHQIDLKLSQDSVLDSIALVPAFNSLESNGDAYAFPKRFRIEVLNEEEDAFETVVDWMEEDFPDPGPYPVFFSGIDCRATRVRMVVPQIVRESGSAYFALGEIYLFRQKPSGWIGDNMAGWADTKINASDSVEIFPRWGLRYLCDDINGLGLPLGDKAIAPEDLLIRSEGEAQLSDNVQFTLDLGNNQNIGPLDFWFASPSNVMALSGFGFPKRILVETSRSPDFKKKRVFSKRDYEMGGHPSELVSVQCMGSEARYIRITMEGFEKYKGETVLGIGEILVSSNDRVWSINCKISARGIPLKYLDQLPRLVDGYCRKRRILSKGEWIKGLAQRRPLDRRLVEVEREWVEANEAWRRLKWRFIVWVGALVFFGLFGGLVLQQRMRKRGINKLKWRITRDLHDEVGSSLGSVSLMAEQLKHANVEVEVKEEIEDLSLLVREAWASLREVVWVIDENTIVLPALIQKLVERTERVLGGVTVDVEISEDCPACLVLLPFKRHLIMLFKEVVHNCARHARATRVWLIFSIVDQHLKISFRDNGCGFDPAKPVEGLGLDSIKERAAEMGGELELLSAPGDGTQIVLVVPLASLLNKTDHLYKTSN